MEPGIYMDWVVDEAFLIPYPTAGNDDPLAFERTFPVTGTYTVEVQAWNCDAAQPVTDTVQVVIYEPGVCLPLESITILGQIAGYLGWPYTFTTQYTPTGASWPICYTWDNGDTEAGSNRIFEVTGTHTLTVTAVNCPSGPPPGDEGVQVEDEHTITISTAPACTQVESIDLTLLSPAPIYAGVSVQFSADLAPDDTTLPYTYTLYLDGTTLVYPQAGSTDPFTFSHTFPVTGSYTIEVAVWNCGMDQAEAVTDTLEVQVVERGGYRVYLPVVIRQD